MNFENVMAKHLNEMRHEISSMTSEFPELTQHFGMGHNGLLDTETEKLLEAFSFMLTESEATRKSLMANKVMAFLENVFPEWFRPDISSSVVEFQAYENFDSILNDMKRKEVLSLKLKQDNKDLKFSFLSPKYITPYFIEKSYFSKNMSQAFLHLDFKNKVFASALETTKTMRVYFQFENIENTFSLFNCLIEDENNFTFSSYEVREEIKRKNITLPIFEDRRKESIFFTSKNKLSVFLNVLNKLNHYFYIDINLEEQLSEKRDNFSLIIPLNLYLFDNLLKYNNFAKTNCIPVFSIYQKSITNVNLNINENSATLPVSSLKDDHILEINQSHIYNFKLKTKDPLASDMSIVKEIKFSLDIPFDIRHSFIFNKSSVAPDSLLMTEGLCIDCFEQMQFLNKENMGLTSSDDSRFGHLITEVMPTIFYPEVFYDSEFLNYLYNLNYFIGKKMNNLPKIMEYFKKIKDNYFNYKDPVYKYLNSIVIQDWYIVARMSDEGKPLLISRYRITNKNREDTVNLLLDRIFEKILTEIAESDLVYQFERD
ncbi:type VI secretion system baseplate subunit TssF [Fluviispira vulneris]|uniref:type VI secretion system baseplate subunit TssF n=1 Tax=Fluviispira vulneris TaxID=2763012 RepID=UPI001647B19D|nr:type VI secretion system baseplate subunit TssF [Fluviispira vulneris]